LGYKIVIKHLKLALFELGDLFFSIFIIRIICFLTYRLAKIYKSYFSKDQPTGFLVFSPCTSVCERCCLVLDAVVFVYTVGNAVFPAAPAAPILGPTSPFPLRIFPSPTPSPIQIPIHSAGQRVAAYCCPHLPLRLSVNLMLLLFHVSCCHHFWALLSSVCHKCHTFCIAS